MRRAITVVRTITYATIIVREEEDIDEARDAAVEEAKALTLLSNSFTYIGRRDEIGQVLDIIV